ncbi:MAG: hypothetical protein KJ674_03660 [Nanoarchaeota archaeon]|nr:hypothetical protein [Nanoarchaeota archaeon]
MNIIELAKDQGLNKKFVSGHRTCSGCGIPQIVRTVLSASKKPVVVANATGCLEVTSTIYPFTSWNVPFIHNAFENVASTISGVESAFNVLKRKGNIKKDINFVAFGGDGGCYTPKTKILTKKGFKDVEKIREKEIVWSINPNTLELEEAIVERMHKYSYNNKILKVNHNFVKFEVSLNHNIPVWDKIDNKLKFIKAQQLLNYGRSKRVNILTGNFLWKGKKEKYFYLPSLKRRHKYSPKFKNVRKINMKFWLEFFGYWLSEGHISVPTSKRNVYNVFIAQTNKKNLKIIEKCLSKLPFNFWYSKDRFVISNQQLWEYLKNFGKSKNKYIPSEIKGLCPKQLKILFDSLILGDGTKMKQKNSYSFKYTTLSKGLRDDIVEIGLKLSYRVSTYNYKRKGRKEYNISFTTYKPTTLANLRKKHISNYNYKGKIYCPELDKNHTLIIEKNGRVSLNGNSSDIGLQALSGALERGHNFVYVMYDNEAYQNTGNQRSSGTPFGANTTTATVGKIHKGKEEFKKDITKIVVAHNIPYVAQASVSNLVDLYNKAEKAFNTKGPAFLNVLQPCTLGWKYNPSLTIKIADLAVKTNFWPLYEVENGNYNINFKNGNRLPIMEFLKLQGRFKHLLKEDVIVDKMQKNIDQKWDALLNLEKHSKI